MTIERWTDQKLDKLADIVDRLVDRADRLSTQLDQLGSQLERTADGIDALILASKPLQGSVPKVSIKPTVPPVAPTDWLNRFLALEAQMQQLTQRVHRLEQNQVSAPSASVVMTIEEEEIEDEPDEILWDFLEPDARGSFK